MAEWRKQQVHFGSALEKLSPGLLSIRNNNGVKIARRRPFEPLPAPGVSELLTERAFRRTRVVCWLLLRC